MVGQLLADTVGAKKPQWCWLQAVSLVSVLVALVIGIVFELLCYSPNRVHALSLKGPCSAVTTFVMH